MKTVQPRSTITALQPYRLLAASQSPPKNRVYLKDRV